MYLIINQLEPTLKLNFIFPFVQSDKILIFCYNYLIKKKVFARFQITILEPKENFIVEKKTHVMHDLIHA